MTILDLRDVTGGVQDGLVADASYIIRFDLKSVSTGTAYFEYANPVTTWRADISNAALTYDFPKDFSTVDSSFTPDGVLDRFTIGTTGTGHDILKTENNH